VKDEGGTNMTLKIESPYLQSPDALWLRGNLHTHTTRSDGALSPQETIQAYSELGHDFLGLSDHNTPPDLEGLDPCGLLLIPANEISGNRGHLLALGFEPSTAGETHQQTLINTVTKAGGMAVLCHPSWGPAFNHYDYQTLEELSAYEGLEIYNGSIEEDPGSPYALDKWDRLLASGRRIWGLANDDAHRSSGQGRGTCVVRAAGRTPQAVLDALKNGSFYASTGAEIETIEVQGNRLSLHAPGAEAILVIGEAGRRLAVVAGDTLDFDATALTGSLFRVEVIGHGGQRAWTQAFRLSGEEVTRRRALVEAHPELKVLRAEHAPELTGDLSDRLWAKAEKACAFLDGDTAEVASLQTELAVLLAGGELFFGLRCTEPDLEAMKLTAAENGSGMLWIDDGVELFLDVEGDATRYFHFMANANGLCYCFEQGAVKGAARTPQIRACSARGKDGYTLEIAVPLSELGVGAEPEAGSTWGFNAVRNRHAAPGRLVFSLTANGNHDPERFGRLQF
jgi:Carbohydrate family 9 binding domain-like